jgi:DNA-binding CsgD family transcriptional regulator
VLARRNVMGAPADSPRPARAQRATLLAVLGSANKEIAAELGVATSTAWTLVVSAMRKLGLGSRVELVEVFGPIARGDGVGASQRDSAGREDFVVLDVPSRRLEPPACLTQAEREVVRGVLEQKSNAEIALERCTSINTVANQLRAVYTKLRISGRSQLLALC